MNVLDTGRLTLTAGTKTIDFRNCMIFMTSNIGAQASQQYLEKLSYLPQKMQQLCLKKYRPSRSLKSHAAQVRS